MATVLFAVQASTSNANPAIPSSPPLLPLICPFIRFRINCIPPYSFTRDTMQATTIEITVISYIPITPTMALSPIVPPPTAMKISHSAILPVATTTIRVRTVPLISTTNTLIPISAPINTTIYGSICQTLYGNSFVSVKFPFLVIKKKMAIVAIAAGRTIKKLA